MFFKGDTRSLDYGSYTCPKPVLQLLVHKTQVPTYLVHGPSSTLNIPRYPIYVPLKGANHLGTWILRVAPLLPRVGVCLGDVRMGSLKLQVSELKG